MLWSGEFGDEYVDRNLESYDTRGAFWREILELTKARSVLEIGCNVGGNLQWISPTIPPGSLYGIDINFVAICKLRERLAEVNSIWAPGRDLPFRDRMMDLVFTMGVLIHQSDSLLPRMMTEMVRCSNEFVLCGEYYAETDTEIEYRGHRGALFKRDYGSRFLEMFPELELVRTGFLSSDDGWDDVTWWLFRRGQ